MNKLFFTFATFACFFFYSNRPAWAEPSHLLISMESEPTTLDWHAAKSPTDRFLISFLMRGLLKYDEKAELQCDLCTTYEVKDNSNTFVFSLKPEKWSDGIPLQASHFVDSLKRLLDPTKHFNPSEELRLLSVTAEAPNRLVIKLSKSSNLLLHILTTPQTFPIRKELMRGKGEEHAMTAVLGPYFLAEWAPNKRIVLEGTENSGRPSARVEFLMGNHAALVEKLKNKRLDILSQPTLEDIANAGQARLTVNPYWATRNLVFNVQKGALADPSLRRAILYSLHRETLPALLKSGDRPATGLIPPGLPGYRDLPLATADPTRALNEKKRSTSAGQNIELSLLFLNQTVESKVAAWLAEQLRPLQITLKPQALLGAAYFKALEKGQFDLAIQIYPFDIAHPLEVLRSFETHSPHNRGHLTHVGYDAILESALRTDLKSSLPTLIDQASQTLELEAVGAIPLSYPTQPFLLGPWVINFLTTPFGDPDLLRIKLK